jgi:hypothetical protein
MKEGAFWTLAFIIVNTPATREPNNRSLDDFALRTIIKRCPSETIFKQMKPGWPGIVDRRAFAGFWNNMTFCLWGRGVELLIDSVTLALNNQVRIFASLLADVAVRYPGAFAVTAVVT